VALRSKTLVGPVALSANNVDSVLYTVPSGETAILRSIRIVNTNSGSSATVKLRKTTSAGTIWKQVVIPAATEHRDETWTCFVDGDTIRGRVVENLGATVIITISGAELEGIAD